jgi:hypothetical protein
VLGNLKERAEVELAETEWADEHLGICYLIEPIVIDLTVIIF